MATNGEPPRIGASSYVRMKKLGSGAYGEVVLAKNTATNEHVRRQREGGAVPRPVGWAANTRQGCE